MLKKVIGDTEMGVASVFVFKSTHLAKTLEGPLAGQQDFSSHKQQVQLNDQFGVKKMTVCQREK